MIRIIAATIIFLAGVGVVVTTGRKSTLPALAGPAYPVVVGDKAGRLPTVKQDILTEAEKVDVTYTPPAEQSAVVSLSQLPAAAQSVETGPPSLIPRQERISHGPRTKAAKRKTGSAQHPPARSPEKPAKEAFNAKECRPDELRSLLKKLKLAPEDSC